MDDASRLKSDDELSKMVDDVFEALSDVITGTSKAPFKVIHWGVVSVGNGEYRVTLDLKRE